VLWDRDRRPDEPPSTPPAETPLEVAEWKQGLWGQVARLPDGQRQALVLRFAERLSYEEIARVMQIPLGTVKSRLFHGLAALRELLAGQSDESIAAGRFGAAPRAEDLSHAL
jgi:RNA polymerase sigma-70 factor, ECF subfamily